MGSFPFQLTWPDIKKVLVDTGLVALAAAVTYLLQTVLPGVHTTNPVVMLLLPVVAAGLNTLLKFINDTRSPEEQRRLSLDDYKALPPEQRRIERLKVAA